VSIVIDANILMRVINQLMDMENNLQIPKDNEIINFTSVHDKFLTTAAHTRLITDIVRKSYFQLSEKLKTWVEEELIPINLENLKKVIKKEKEFTAIETKIMEEWRSIKEMTKEKW
jgi:hypothetical protein